MAATPLDSLKWQEVMSFLATQWHQIRHHHSHTTLKPTNQTPTHAFNWTQTNIFPKKRKEKKTQTNIFPKKRKEKKTQTNTDTPSLSACHHSLQMNKNPIKELRNCLYEQIPRSRAVGQVQTPIIPSSITQSIKVFVYFKLFVGLVILFLLLFFFQLHYI